MKENATRQLKKFFGIGILLCAFGNANAQYVLNGSFESVNTCPHRPGGSGIGTDVFSQNKFPDNWFQPTNGSTDLLNNCPNTYSYNSTINPGGPWVWTNDNFAGCQAAQNGSNYIGLYTSGAGSYGNADYREMIQSTLNISGGLVGGQCYILEFYVSLADRSEFATPIQVNFSGGSAPPTHYDAANGYTGTLGLYPNLSTPIITNATGWERILMPYTAIGGEKYMTIGFFEDESSPNIVAVTAQNPATCNVSHAVANVQAYYYIDNVSLVVSGGPSYSPTSGYTFSNTTLNNINWSNSNVLLDGNITLTGTSSQITNCTVHCTKNCTITIPNGAETDISSSTFGTGCDHMWNGFRVQSGGTLKMNTNSVVEDAIIAIDIDGGKWQIENTLFNKNAGDIRMSNINIPSSTYYIKGVQFDHTQPLKEHITPTGKGLYGIQIADMSNTSGYPIKVGGSNSADICSFIEGDYGIQSNNAEVVVERCVFSKTAKCAIDFQGNNATYKRALQVTASSFADNKRAILSQHKTQLTVKSSFFGRCAEHAIEWSDNHDCYLLIGDVTYPANGNTFLDNAWTCVTAWDNKSTQATPTTIANDIYGTYTSIIIANNTITAPFAAGGFLIGEWTLGQHVSYHELNITANTLNHVTKGIQMYNVKGYGGVFGNNPPSSLPAQNVYGNMLYTTTSASAHAFGIKVGNAPGFIVKENGVASDNNGNWQNSGILFESSRYTEAYGNIINAGTGIDCGLDMVGSYLHCNWLGSYAVGFALHYTYLRSGSTDLHGSAAETANNTVSYTAIPWNTDLSVYNSDVSYNQWVWNNAATNLAITYTGSTGSGSVISSTTGTNTCLGPFGIYTNAGTNTAMSFSDANAQWLANYNYEIQRLLTDSGSSSVASANIKAIIGIEDYIGAGNYNAANTALTSLTPSNAVEGNYKKVLSIFNGIQYPSKRELTTAEIDTLIAIAAQYTRIAGQSVTLARTFLAVKYNMSFEDENFVDMQDVVDGTAEIVSPCSIAPASGTQLSLMDDHGLDLPIYVTVDANGYFAFDPGQLNYYASLNPGTLYRIYATHGSKYTVVNQDYKTLADWLAESRIDLDLAGTAVEVDTITAIEYETIDHYTEVFDKDGNRYSVGTILFGGEVEMLIEKHSSGNDSIWSRLYDGPVSKEDTTTCIVIDDAGDIYVAGKVNNGLSNDFQILKYDSDGLLLWASYLADSLKRDNTPVGIMVDESGYVFITGTCNTDTSAEFRYVKLAQCLPSTERQANPQQKTAQTSSIELYPNPSAGKITIVMKDQTAGTLELFNLAGQLVYSQQVAQSGKIVLPAEKVSNGVYLLKFTGAGNPEYKKLVIQRN